MKKSITPYTLQPGAICNTCHKNACTCGNRIPPNGDVLTSLEEKIRKIMGDRKEFIESLIGNPAERLKAVNEFDKLESELRSLVSSIRQDMKKEVLERVIKEDDKVENHIKNKITWWIAFHLPPRVLLWAFVRASSMDKLGPDTSYSRIYKEIVKKYKLKGEV